MIKETSFDEIFLIWRERLWPGRVSAIESNSAMVFASHTYDMKNMTTKPTFFSYIIDGKIVGVNSGHLCGDNSYRSRGLWVFPEHRKQGIGKELLLATIEQAKKENANFIWSYPKKTSWATYASAGFMLVSDWEQSELDLNAYCRINL